MSSGRDRRDDEPARRWTTDGPGRAGRDGRPHLVRPPGGSGPWAAVTAPATLLGLAAVLLAPVSAAAAPAAGPWQAGPQESPTPIAQVRIDADGDRVPDRRGDTVTVAGRATTGSSVLDRFQLRVFVQDPTAGVMLFSPRRDARVQRGDSVVATGIVEHYRGLTQIRTLDYRVVDSTPRVPPAVALPDELDELEALEGSLVHATAYVKGTGSNEGGSFLLLGPAEAPEALFAVFVPRNHGIPPELDRLSVGDEVTVTGPLGQYDADPPYDSYYQVYPRSPDDLDAAGLSRILLQQGLRGAVALLALALLGLLLLLRKVRSRTRELAVSERAERSARERLSLLLDHAPVALWTVDQNLRITWAEGRGLLDMGMGHEEIVGLSMPEVLGADRSVAAPDGDGPESPGRRTPAAPPGDVVDAYRAALEGEPGQFDVEWQGRTWHVRLQPLREDGAVTGVVGAALDATRHRDIERRLEEQRAHFQKLFDEAPEAIVLVDEEDRVLEVNPEFERMFGYAPGDAVGRLVNELISVPGRENEATELTERVARGERIEVDAVRRHRDGSLIEVSILATPLEVGGQRLVYGIYRDITEQKALEAQLLHSQRLEAVGQLAGGIAHDFNNILTAILGHTRVLLQELGEDGRLREDLVQIEAAGERAAGLTRQLLTFSRRDIATPRSVDLNTVVGETRDLLARLIEERVELDFELADGIPPVRADPGQLEQIVMNLVINARDAMPDGGRVTVSTAWTRGRIEGRPTEEGDGRGWVVLAVRDEGRGMAPDEEARMFEPFFTTKGPGEGTGLGLSTVYGIVEQAGGFIDVETGPEAGTTVRIHLPVTLPEEGDPAPPSLDGADPDEEAPPGQGELVLLVDDDRPVRDVARRILERAGYRVVPMGSGRAALEYCDASDVAPDAVVTDIVMPGMTGYELVDRLRQRWPGIRVLLMTGYTEATSVPHDEVTEILRKPFDARTLVRRLREELVVR